MIHSRSSRPTIRFSRPPQISPWARMSRRFVSAPAACAAAALLATTLAAPAAVAATPDQTDRRGGSSSQLTLAPVGTYSAGVFDESAAEIVAYYGKRVYTVNALAGAVDVIDVTNPSAPTKLYSIAGSGVANSIAIRRDGLGVIALEAPVKTDPGSLVFFDARSAASAPILGSVTAGAQPDMVAFSPDGRYVLSANEGEPNDEYTVDPEGSVSVVTVARTVKAPGQADVRTADFHAFETGGTKMLEPTVRVFAGIPGSLNPVSANLEPEYITVDGRTAYVTLQEANAVAVVDVRTAKVERILPLGFKDLSVAGNGIDPSDRDPKGAPTINIRTFPGLFGMYMPDAIASYSSRGETYLVTANEGDAREWGSYEEGARVADLSVCATSPLAALTGAADLGRLNVTTENGFNEASGCYDALYAFGARSFSIWTTGGRQVFDSGESLERVTAEANPAFFNSNHTASNLEGRSDDKGPEPEGVAIGEIQGRTYAFIGLERVGGIAVYDVTDPRRTSFVTYVNNRDFSVSVEDAVDTDAALAAAGDLGPEGVTFIDGRVSPTGKPMLAVGNEVSGTTTLFSINLKRVRRE